MVYLLVMIFNWVVLTKCIYFGLFSKYCESQSLADFALSDLMRSFQTEERRVKFENTVQIGYFFYVINSW